MERRERCCQYLFEDNDLFHQELFTYPGTPAFSHLLTINNEFDEMHQLPQICERLISYFVIQYFWQVFHCLSVACGCQRGHPSALLHEDNRVPGFAIKSSASGTQTLRPVTVSFYEYILNIDHHDCNRHYWLYTHHHLYSTHHWVLVGRSATRLSQLGILSTFQHELHLCICILNKIIKTGSSVIHTQGPPQGFTRPKRFTINIGGLKRPKIGHLNF